MKKIILLFISIISISCLTNNESIEENIDYDTINEQEIQLYLKENNLTAEKTESGLYYITHNEGEGEFPSNNSEVTVSYKGYFLDNIVFDENEEFTYSLTNLIPGFSEAVQLLKSNGEMTAIIPSKLAYGKNGTLNIPSGAVLIFDIKLISFKN